MIGWRWNKKNTVEGCKFISTSFLKKYGYFCGWKTGGMKWTNGMGEEVSSIGFWVSVEGLSGEIHFQYSQMQKNSNEKESLDYPVRLTATTCHFGGKRWWFICPLIKEGIACDRRVLKLYLGGEKYFGCRHCYDLTYKSVQEHDKRIDYLVKNPDLLLGNKLDLNSMKKIIISLKAISKLEEKERKNRP